jgi:DNA-binding NtrC family response regulator
MNLGRVLVLEDEPFIALDLEGMLEEFGATSVVSLNTRADALRWLEDNRPDVAIVDPRVNDGICTDVVEVLAMAKVPFVVYSGAGVDENASEAFSHGEWLSKPTMPELLRDTLERLVRAHRDEGNASPSSTAFRCPARPERRDGARRHRRTPLSAERRSSAADTN